MTTLENLWLPALNVLLQSTMILGVGLLLAWALHRRALVQRVLVLRAALCATALSAILCVALLGRVRPLWNLQRATPVEALAPPMIEAAIATQETRIQAASPTNISPPMVVAPTVEKAAPLRLKYLAVLLWLSVAAALLLWNLACHFHLWRLRRHAVELNDESVVQLLSQLAREMKIAAPRLLHSAQVSGPLLCGLWRPVLLWPADGEFDGDTNAQRAIFVHELTHLQRRDLWWNALSRVLCAILWPQVLAWRVARQLEANSEECCDAAVIEAGCAPREYAACLLAWAERWSLPRAERVAGAGVVPLRSALGRRVQAILDDSKRGSLRLSRRSRCVAGLVVCGGVGLSLLVGAADVSESQSRVAKAPLGANTLVIANDSPENTVRALLKALDEQDAKMIAQLVDGAMPAADLQRIFDMIFLQQAQVENWHLTIGDVNVQGDATTATVTAKTTAEWRAKGKLQRHDDNSRFQLRRFDSGWKILGPTKRDMTPQGLRGWNGFLQTIAPPEIEMIEAWGKNRGTAILRGAL